MTLIYFKKTVFDVIFDSDLYLLSEGGEGGLAGGWELSGGSGGCQPVTLTPLPVGLSMGVHGSNSRRGEFYPTSQEGAAKDLWPSLIYNATAHQGNKENVSLGIAGGP